MVSTISRVSISDGTIRENEMVINDRYNERHVSQEQHG